MPSVAAVPGVPGSLRVSLALMVPVRPLAPVSAPSLFRPFAADSSSSLTVSSAPPSPSSSGLPSFSASSFTYQGSSAPPDPSATFAFGHPDDLPENSPPDAIPRELDPALPAAVSESACSEFRRMMAFIVDLFLQAAGSPSIPPPRALFEDFFSSSAPPSLVFLNWFKRIRTALSEADSRLASFVASGRGDYLFLPSRSLTYAVHGDFALGGVVLVNPSLLSLFERCLKPSNHVGLSIREAAAFKASLRSQSEVLSHSMWVLSSLLAFVLLQNFAPEDLSLCDTLVTSLSKSLAHQASLTATHMAFLGL